MKIVIAPDSFKESLTATQVAREIAAGLRSVWPDAVYRLIPMADGGEGTVAAVTAAIGGRIVSASVTGPMGAALTACFGLSGGGAGDEGTTVGVAAAGGETAGSQIAILEMAAASGLEHVPPAQRNPLLATSYGTGELLRAALDAEVGRCVLGIGGSATVDGGTGMLQALGARLLDAHGGPIARGGGALAQLDRIDLSTLDPRLSQCMLEVACDVDNPLLGPQGAAAFFGPQKGATPEMVVALEAGLANLARVLARDVGVDVAAMPGAGAAGGMGAALVACLGAKIRPGVELVAEIVGLEAAIRDADLVITGEGRIDAQTLHGKLPVGVAAIARRHGTPVIALAGSVSVDAAELAAHGIDAVFSIVPGPCSRDQAFAAAAANLRATSRNLAAVWSAAAAPRAEGTSD